MQITSAQCRAARSLLNWTQEQLATYARVSRATIADFESNSRQPIKNNLIAIEDCMFSSGIEFLPDSGDAGVGVRFRERKLEYINHIQLDRFNRCAKMKMRYAGQPFTCVISLDAIDDFYRTRHLTDAEFDSAIRKLQNQIFAAVERQAKNGIQDGQLIVTYGMLDTARR